MRRTWMAALAVFAAALPVGRAAALSESVPEGIEWVNDWDRAVATAAERGVPLLVSFANDG